MNCDVERKVKLTFSFPSDSVLQTNSNALSLYRCRAREVTVFPDTLIVFVTYLLTYLLTVLHAYTVLTVTVRNCCSVLGIETEGCEVCCDSGLCYRMMIIVICSNNKSVYPRRKLSLSGCTPGSEEPCSTAGIQSVSVSRQSSVDEGSHKIVFQHFYAAVHA